MTQPEIEFRRNDAKTPRWFYIVGVLIVILLAIVVFKDCSKPPVPPPVKKFDSTEIYKAIIRKTQFRSDSAIASVRKGDSVRIEIKYRYLKGKENLGTPHSQPCDSFAVKAEALLAVADSLIKRDSTIIDGLYFVHSQDSASIINYRRIVYNDSTEKVSLRAEIATKEKQVRRQRLGKRIAIAVGGVLAVFAIIK